MPDPTPHRTRRLVTCTLALAAGLLVTLAPTPSGAPPSVGCKVHIDAAQDVWPPWTCMNEKERHKVCRAIGKQCKKAVNSAHKCLLRQEKAQLDVDKHQCSFSNVPDKKTCKNVVKGQWKDRIDINKGSRETALTECEAQTANCIATCHL